MSLVTLIGKSYLPLWCSALKFALTRRNAKTDESAGKCPVMHTKFRSNRDWWPDQLDLKGLHQNSPLSNPMGKSFNYAEEFKKLDLKALKNDLSALMTDRRIGGRPTSATTADCASAWPGTVRARTASPTAAAGRSWTAAFCAVEQLAGQRKPRQSAPAAVAHCSSRPHGRGMG